MIFLKKMYFDKKILGNKSIGNEPHRRLLKSLDIMAGSLKEPNTRWLSSKHNKLCDRLKLLLQEKQAGNNSDKYIEEMIAIVVKLLEHKCISTKQQTLSLVKSVNQMKIMK